MKRFLATLLIVLGLATSFAFASSSAYVSAAAKDEVCKGVGAVSGGSGCATAQGQPTVDTLIKSVLKILSWVVGVISIIMIVIAGLFYVTSNGDSGKIGTAKNTLIYAIVGLVVVAFAQAIVQFVLGRV
jgi:hypothetical protein